MSFINNPNAARLTLFDRFTRTRLGAGLAFICVGVYPLIMLIMTCLLVVAGSVAFVFFLFAYPLAAGVRIVLESFAACRNRP